MTNTIIGTRKLVLYVDTVDFSDSVSSAKLVSGDKDTDFVSFAEALAGGAREYTLELTIRQDTDAASLWYYIWNEAGDDNSFELWPNGQDATVPATPTATYPKFSGTVTITEPDGDFLGGDADASPTAVLTVDVAWKCTAKPTLAIA